MLSSTRSSISSIMTERLRRFAIAENINSAAKLKTSITIISIQSSLVLCKLKSHRDLVRRLSQNDTLNVCQRIVQLVSRRIVTLNVLVIVEVHFVIEIAMPFNLQKVYLHIRLLVVGSALNNTILNAVVFTCLF